MRTLSPLRAIAQAMRRYPLMWILYIAVIMWLGMTAF